MNEAINLASCEEQTAPLTLFFSLFTQTLQSIDKTLQNKQDIRTSHLLSFAFHNNSPPPFCYVKGLDEFATCSLSRS